MGLSTKNYPKILHECSTCGGPAVCVMIKGHTRFAPNRVRVQHSRDCKFYHALAKRFPKLIGQREEAVVDYILPVREEK